MVKVSKDDINYNLSADEVNTKGLNFFQKNPKQLAEG